jgi:hypothetical protein
MRSLVGMPETPMSTDALPDADLVRVVLMHLAPKIGVSVLESDDFRKRYSLDVDSVVRFDQADAAFARSILFQAVRDVLATEAATIDVESKDGRVWKVTRDPSSGITVRREGTTLSLRECLSMAPDIKERLEWLDQQKDTFRVRDRHIEEWQTILLTRAAQDEELDRLLDEFRLTPAHFVSSIKRLLRRGSFETSDLVPSGLRYFDRLAGEPTDGAGVSDFIATTMAAHVRGLMRGSVSEGIKHGLLLSSHSAVAELFDLGSATAEEVSSIFDWLAKHGDRISQVGAIEVGLRVLPLFPTIESSLATMIREIARDDPEDPDGRLRLLSSLVSAVEGELARRNIARGRRPFWRRLASIAQASLIEREVIALKLAIGSLAGWAMRTGYELYEMQTLIDLRREPRWFPEFVSARQLKAEFIGRIAGAAQRHRESVQSSDLTSLLFGAGSSVIDLTHLGAYPFLPGPLEGAMEAVKEIPSALETNVRSSLEAEELTPKSFVGLVNSSLIFKVGPELSELAAQALRRVGYQLRQASENENAFSLLRGLATVCAVTRSKELAKEVRILARGVRRKNAKNLSPSAIANIALVSAAANNDPAEWGHFVGEWLTELAFSDMTREEALALQGDLHRLLHIEPSLWETCGRAEAALAAFLGSFPMQMEETPMESQVDSRE